MKLVKSILIPLILGISLVLGSCAFLQKVDQPTKVEMVVLSDLAFGGIPTGVEVPATFGDFSLTHNILSVTPSENGQMFFISWYPMDVDNPMLFILVGKSECPEPIALSAWSSETDITTHWIYNSEGQVRQVDEETYDFFLELDHPCTGGDPDKPDATLTI